MKKTLIALAALAVAGAASADYSLTGEFGFGYKATESAAGAKTSGLSQTDGSITLAASEDLGNGLSISGKTTFDLKGRDSVAAEDASVMLSGSFGSVMLGSIEAGNGIIDRGTAGAPTMGLDGDVLDGGKDLDIIKYTSPAMGDVKFSVSATDEIGSDTDEFLTYGVGVTYSAGPIDAGLDYTSYEDTATATGKSRTRLSGSYDLGMATVGAGYQMKSADNTEDDTQWVVGVSAPVGDSLTVGAVYASQEQGTMEKTGWELGATYSLSKRTSVNVAINSWSTKGVSGDNTASRIKLVHKF